MMRIIDMHCDTLLEGYLKNQHLRRNKLSVDFETMKKNEAFLLYFCQPEVRPKQMALMKSLMNFFVNLLSFTKKK